jgi:hypothetical protein
MANLITLYWRDIPAQVIAERGRGRQREQAKVELPRRFSIAIDAAAMRDGADSTDDYLAEWRRSEPRHVVKILTLKRQRMRRRLMPNIRLIAYGHWWKMAVKPPE